MSSKVFTVLRAIFSAKEHWEMKGLAFILLSGGFYFNILITTIDERTSSMIIKQDVMMVDSLKSITIYHEFMAERITLPESFNARVELVQSGTSDKAELRISYQSKSDSK